MSYTYTLTEKDLRRLFQAVARDAIYAAEFERGNPLRGKEPESEGIKVGTSNGLHYAKQFNYTHVVLETGKDYLNLGDAAEQEAV